MKITKNQLKQIIKEEIKKTLSEAGEIEPKPAWMTPERYRQFVAQIMATRAKEDEERAQWDAKEDEARKWHREYDAEKKAEREADLAAARAGRDRLKSMQGDFGGPDETPAQPPEDWDVSYEGAYLKDEDEWVPGVYLKGKWVPLEDGFSLDGGDTHSTAGTNSPGKVANRLIDTANDLAGEARDYEALIRPGKERDALLDIFTSDVFDKIEAARGAEKLAKPISKGKFFEVKTRKRR